MNILKHLNKFITEHKYRNIEESPSVWKVIFLVYNFLKLSDEYITSDSDA